jgi:ribosomal protein S18
MYKTQYKSRSPITPWQTTGTYANEADAISAAIKKKRAGALIVRVMDSHGVIYSL